MHVLKTGYRAATACGTLAAVILLGLVITQTAQLVTLAASLHPAAGTFVLWGLLVVYAACLLAPVILYLRLPSPLEPPSSEECPEFDRHLHAVGRRLTDNHRAGQGPFRSRPEIEGGLAFLGTQADEVARRAASEVFVATAVSQHGSLDALIVLGVQARMVWRIAHLYHQRPGVRELARLYTNVGATAFIAGELEDLDLSDQIQPVVSGVLGSMAGTFPGLQTVSTVFVTSVLGGAANAFLTLRVGVISKQYCAALTSRPRWGLRRTAVVQAGAMLSGIVYDGAKRVSVALVRASGETVSGTVRTLGERAREAGSALTERVREAAGRGKPGHGRDDPTS